MNRNRDAGLIDRQPRDSGANAHSKVFKQITFRPPGAGHERSAAGCS